MGDINVIQDYASRLRQGVEEDDQIREFRRRFPHRFQELCMLHLSFLVDIPWSIFDQRNGSAQENTPKSAIKRLLAVSRIGHQPNKSDPAPEHLVNNALRLIDRLDNDQDCSAEGIFRKAGHMQRKRQLVDALLQPQFEPETFPWDSYTVHDLATALKSLVTHLPSPLLTNRLIPLFLRVAGLVEPDVHGIVQSFDALASSIPSSFNQSADDLHWNLIRSKQLKALRLLVQLLPLTNRQLFTRLMELLSRVVRLQLNNRMTSANLGTVFGPVLFPNELAQDALNPNKYSHNMASECHKKFKQLSALVTVLIEANMDLFLIPRSLAEDVHTNRTMLLDLLENSPTDTESENRKDADFSENTNSEHSRTPLETIKIMECDKPSSSASASSCSPISFSSSPPGTAKVWRVFQSPNESPPLHTGIRFATPTMVNSLTVPLPCSPPKRVNSSPSLISLPRNQTEGSSESSVSRHPVFGAKVHSLFYPNSGSPHASAVSHDRTRCRGSFGTVNSPKGLPNEPESTSVKHSVSIPDLDERSTHKPGKKRRYTELRLPSTMNRSGPRRHMFSPCPPLGFHAFRRAVAEKRSSPSDLSLRPHVTEIQPLSTW
ncbi:hypothetical protein FGIG_07848 [Fasciola gigantica]|uniref:Rho-GAP domain-containing protein n=1 Tax=Fasciola gigantica TaxID=46835 RepID=A0A504YGN9_FASGI|nr:hypothetical protein FGIG_07848 [Fasciola gigantica]